MIKILTMIWILTSMNFIFLNHPMTMGLILLMETTLMAMILSLISSSSWYPYILFLIMIGGMLILFIYMTSIASNEKFHMSNKMMMASVMMIMMTSPVIFIDKMIILPNLNIENLNTLESISFSLNKYLTFPNLFISAMIITYLFLCLIAVVKITGIKHGPLRHST